MRVTVHTDVDAGTLQVVLDMPITVTADIAGDTAFHRTVGAVLAAQEHLAAREAVPAGLRRTPITE